MCTQVNIFYFSLLAFIAVLKNLLNGHCLSWHLLCLLEV